MTAMLIIECGVAQTRAALIDGDIVTRFWFGPARGDEATDQAPRAGRKFTGRVKSINRSLNAAFIDIGDALDAYLPLKKNNEALAAEGALVGVTVKSPPRQGKGAVLKFNPDLEIQDDAPRRAPPIDDPVIDAVKAIGACAKKILIDDGPARAVLAAAGLKAEIEYEEHAVALFDLHGASDALGAAFERTVALKGGGRLIIDETQALTAIDVDSAGLGASSPARLREKMAIAAASEAVRQIALRNIGGHVVIDFPAIGAKSARTRFRAHLEKALLRIDGAGGGSFSKSGLFSFTAPHIAQSLVERFTECSPGDPVAGRHFTLDWQAKSALRACEHRLRASPRVKLRLAAGKDLYGYLNDRKTWIDRLNDRYGPRVEMTVDEKLEERGFDLSE